MPKRLLLILLLFLHSFIFAKIHEVTLFQTSDIHGTVDRENGGIYKLTSVIKRETAKIGSKNKYILIDCGDLYSGTPEGLIDGGRLFVKYLNYNSYDVFVPGNHEFDLGVVNLVNLANLFNGSFIVCNLVLDSQHKVNNLTSWKIIKRDGLKVCIIGATIKHNETSLAKDGYEILSIFKSLKNIIPNIMKEKPDIIVLAVHQGVYSSNLGNDSLKFIAKKFPQIDIVLAGHSHEVINGEALSEKTLLVEPGKKGEYLSKVLIRYDDIKKEKVITTELIPVSNVDSDKDIKKYLAKDLLVINNELNKVLTKGTEVCKDFPLYISKMLRDWTGADVGLLGFVYSANKVENAQITLRNIYNIFPYEDTVVVVNMKGKDLKYILNKGFSIVSEENKFKAFSFYGIAIDKNDNNKISSIKSLLTNEKIENNDIVKVAVTSYLAEGGGGRFPIFKRIKKQNPSSIQDTNIKIREHLIETLSN